jgi:hypothetical protein
MRGRDLDATAVPGSPVLSGMDTLTLHHTASFQKAHRFNAGSKPHYFA